MGDKGKVFDLIIIRQTTNIKIQGIGIKISAGHLLSAKLRLRLRLRLKQ
jgi:hypothetical protein